MVGMVASVLRAPRFEDLRLHLFWVPQADQKRWAPLHAVAMDPQKTTGYQRTVRLAAMASVLTALSELVP